MNIKKWINELRDDIKYGYTAAEEMRIFTKKSSSINNASLEVEDGK